MKAMVFTAIASLQNHPTPLSLVTLPDPRPGPGEALIEVAACGVCHTELDEIEGRALPARLPMVPGHQVVGRVLAIGEHVTNLQVGQRVGVAWIYSACGQCAFCRNGQENLCPDFRATGRDVFGGYAQYMVALADFVHPIPDVLGDGEAAPLLCAGAIGYRALRLANLRDGQALGLTGFGSSNHLVLQMARHLLPNTPVFVFSRNPQERELARALGAAWAGGIEAAPPQKPDAIIDTTPVWKPVLESLKHLNPGGRLVVNAIRKEEGDRSELLRLDYPAHLWLEKEIKSVANVTRQDVRECLALAVAAGIRPEYQAYPLSDANQALLELKQGKIRGSKVLVIPLKGKS